MCSRLHYVLSRHCVCIKHSSHFFPSPFPTEFDKLSVLRLLLCVRCLFSLLGEAHLVLCLLEQFIHTGFEHVLYGIILQLHVVEMDRPIFGCALCVLCLRSLVLNVVPRSQKQLLLNPALRCLCMIDYLYSCPLTSKPKSSVDENLLLKKKRGGGSVKDWMRSLKQESSFFFLSLPPPTFSVWSLGSIFFLHSRQYKV